MTDYPVASAPRQPYESTPLPTPTAQTAQTAQTAPTAPAAPPQGSALPNQGNLHLDEPERQVLAHLRAHGSVGPTELARAYGASVGTWSRRLSRLKAEGIVEKSGQKHYLTPLGRQLADLVASR